jgi:predicted dienelactone hydrolase
VESGGGTPNYRVLALAVGKYTGSVAVSQEINGPTALLRSLAMRSRILLLAAFFWVSAAAAEAAGLRLINVPADAAGPALTGAVWSPCAMPPQEVEVEGIALPGVKDCSIEGDKLPLVVISHGRGGSFIGHHDTAETLADAGFIVAAINHPGDTSTDMSRSDDLAAFVERPTDIKRLIDFMLQASSVATKIDPQRIGFFGFSRGGYTGLVLLGANPDWAVVTEFCQQSSSHACEQIRRKEFPTEPLAHDVRIKAAVIADPLAIMFSHASFAAIRVPVQLWQSQRGGDGVLPEHVAAVDKNLPAPHEYHVVPNSSHFALLTPCPPAVAQARPELCTDAPGFDRVAFHKEFDAEVLAFLRRHLAGADKP